MSMFEGLSNCKKKNILRTPCGLGKKMTTGCRDHKKKKRFAHIYIYILYIFFM